MVKVFLPFSRVEIQDGGERFIGLKAGQFARVEEPGLPANIITNPLIVYTLDQMGGGITPLDVDNYIFIIESAGPPFQDSDLNPSTDAVVTPQES
jgi:hypothetical protein